MVGYRRAFDAEVGWWRLHLSNSVFYVKFRMVEQVSTFIYIQAKRPPITMSSACEVTVVDYQ